MNADGRHGRQVSVEHCAVVPQPLEQLFVFLADPENRPRWVAGVVRSRRRPAATLASDETRYRESSDVLGWRFTCELVVAGYEEDRLIEIMVVSGPVCFLGATIAYLVSAVEGGTLVTLRTQLPVPDRWRPLAPLLRLGEAWRHRRSLAKLSRAALFA